MIPRYQRILYWLLVGGIVVMSLVLIRGCQRNHQRIADARDQSPIAAPTDTPPEVATIASASDDDGTVTLPGYACASRGPCSACARAARADAR